MPASWLLQSKTSETFFVPPVMSISVHEMRTELAFLPRLNKNSAIAAAADDSNGGKAPFIAAARDSLPTNSLPRRRRRRRILVLLLRTPTPSRPHHSSPLGGHSQMKSTIFLGFLLPCQHQIHTTSLPLVRNWLTPGPPLLTSHPLCMAPNYIQKEKPRRLDSRWREISEFRLWFDL